MNNIKRIFSTDYKVNHDDILHARATTTGIVELDFAFKNIKFKYVFNYLLIHLIPYEDVTVRDPNLIIKQFLSYL